MAEKFLRVVPGFVKEIAGIPGGEDILKCFSCGSCTVACAERPNDPEYDPRKIIRMALLGLEEQVLSSDFIWYCSMHYTCSERCPQGVKISEVMNAIRNIRLAEGLPVREKTKKSPQYKKLDPHFRFEITNIPGGETLTGCFACGSCTAECPEKEFSEESSPRNTIRKALLGLREEVLTSRFVEDCSAHYRCQFICPQGVNISRLMNAIRILAEKKGYSRPRKPLELVK